MKDRRYFVPEVVQTSAIDCGPASLSALLAGFGRHVSYGRLREACQTSVDGTSIDAIEDLANRLGLEAEQIVLPPDHISHSEAAALPAVAVVRLSNGLTHFVVIWRRHGNKLQIMDPAKGRCWVAMDEFLKSLYDHQMAVPAEGWREWAQSPEFILTLKARMCAAGTTEREAMIALARAFQDSTWRAIATLDAAARMLQAVARSGAFSRTPPPKRNKRGEIASTEPFRVLVALWERAVDLQADAFQVIPQEYWSVRLLDDGQLLVRGAVLVRIKARSAAAIDLSALPPEVAAAASEAPPKPFGELWKLLKRDGVLAPATVAAALFVSAAGVVLQAVLFRALVQGGQEFSEKGQRIGAIAAIIALLVILLALDVPAFATLVAMGRHLETRFRTAFLQKLPRIGERYFHSRLMSDMAERSHSVHALRALPTLAGQCLGSVFELLLTMAAVIWVDPHLWLLAILLAGVAAGLPLAAQPFLGERELRVRTHAGALSRFYFDALLGLIPVRTHVADGVLRREQRGLLSKWADAGLEAQRIAIAVESIQLFMGFGLAAAMVVSHIARHPQSWGTLLLVYWGLNIPMIGQQLVSLACGYPLQRNIVLRLLEPLRALENEHEEQWGSLEATKPRGVAVTMQNAGILIGGRPVLKDLNLKVSPGQHVAIVGTSGAGKSTFLGLLLGWHNPSAGTIRVDGEPHASIDFDQLRRATAWIDPTVHLWNGSLVDNLRYGTTGELAMSVGQAADEAGLTSVLEKLPDGMQTRLGDSGGLLSGGEGERVRICRALLRPGVRLAVLDEPFRGLDANSRKRLLRTAREVWRGATMFFVTHDIADTQSFDKVLVMEDGTIVEAGSPRDLARIPESRYGRLLRSEFEWKQQLFEGEHWRRLEMRNGILLEEISGKGNQERKETPDSLVSDRANREMIA